MSAMAPQITSLTIVFSTAYSDADQRKHQSSASLAFVQGIHQGPVNSPHKWPVTRKMFPFYDVIMLALSEGTGSKIRSFGVTFAGGLDNLFDKYSNCWWFETTSSICDVTQKHGT